MGDYTHSGTINPSPSVGIQTTVPEKDSVSRLDLASISVSQTEVSPCVYSMVGTIEASAESLVYGLRRELDSYFIRAGSFYPMTFGTGPRISIVVLGSWPYNLSTA